MYNNMSRILFVSFYCIWFLLVLQRLFLPPLDFSGIAIFNGDVPPRAPGAPGAPGAAGLTVDELITEEGAKYE